MNHKIIKKVLLSCALAGALFNTQSPLLAQSPAPQDSSILSLYNDYADAGFAVQWKVPTGDLSELRSRMPRYSYLLFYTADDLLAAQNGPFMRFGFFKSRNEAEQFVADNQTAFPGLRVVKVSAQEHRSLMQRTAAEGETTSDYAWLNDASGDSQQPLQDILQQAKALYINQRYSKALEYYSALSLVTDTKVAHWAWELKGLTHESLGQREQAERTYRQLLATAEGDEPWFGRVNQRLRALATAADDGKANRRKSKYQEDQSPYYYRGFIGQSYNYVTSGGKHVLDRDVLSIIATNVDAVVGYRHPEHEVEVRFNGYNNYDLLDYPADWVRGDDNRTRIKRAQVDYTHVDTGLRAVGGRQKDYDSGMYLYFDGVSVKYPVTDKITLGVNGGVPVQFSDFYDHHDRQFYSVQAAYDHNEYWRVAGYVTHQTLYGEIDRAAYGGRLQYVDDRFSSYLNIDYDYEFAEVNILRWSGTYKFNPQHQLSATYGRQRSPFLTSTNVLLGQPYLDLENYLRDQLNRDYLLWNALERTGIYEYGTLSHQYEVDEGLHITADVYHAVSSEMPIFEYEDDWIRSSVATKGAEFRYSSFGLQAVAQDFLGMNDSATLSFRHSDTTLASSNLIQIGERLRFWDNKVSLAPKLHLKHTEKKRDDTSRSNVRGSVTLTYKPWRSTEFRLEAGNEAIRFLEENNSLDQSYLFMGYQTRF